MTHTGRSRLRGHPRLDFCPLAAFAVDRLGQEVQAATAPASPSLQPLRLGDSGAGKPREREQRRTVVAAVKP
jgi:hypothetical protein